MKLFLSFLMVFFSSILYLLLSISFFISSRNLLGSILSSQTDPPTLKNLDFRQEILIFVKNYDLDPKMVLKAFGGSLGLLVGALGGLLAALWGLYIDHRGLPDSSGNFLGPRLLASGCFFSFIFVLLSSMSYFICCRGLLGSILSSQADPPTLKNLEFSLGKLYIYEKTTI